MQLNTIRSIARFLYRTLARLDVVGVEKVPEKGGCILATNHLSRLDPPLVYVILKRDDMTALVADKYKKFPGINWLVNKVGGIWLNRDEADIRAMREARDYLRAGGMLGIAPEGTRSKNHSLLPAKTGVAYLAEKAGVPIVPSATWGTETAVAQLLRLRRPTIHLRFGDLFHLPPVDRRQRDAGLQRNTDEIMCRIAVLLPEQYRGAYRDHPRVKELLEDGEAEPLRPINIS